MPMKLLRPEESRSRKETENVTKQIRSDELDSLIKKKRKELGDLESRCAFVLDETRIQHEAEVQQWNTRIKPLKEEIESLERRKLQALLPLEEREKKVKDAEEALLQREESVVVRETKVHSREEKAVRDEEANASLSASLGGRMKTLNERGGAIEAGEESLAEEYRMFYQDKEKLDQERRDFDTFKSTQEAIINGKNTSLDERKSRLDKLEKDLSSRERALIDKYNTLQRTVERTRKH